MSNLRQFASTSKGLVISGALIGSRELIADLGGDPEAIARAAGVPDFAFENPDVYVDAECLIDYFEIAALQCECPEFGLLHGARLPMGIFGQTWLLMRDAKSVAEALQYFVKYYGLATNVGTFRFETDHGGRWLHYSVLPLGAYTTNQVINATLARVCLFVRENARANWHPLRVRLRQGAVANGSFARFFGCDPEFNDVTDAIFIEDGILKQKLGTGALRELSQQTVAAHARLRGSRLSVEVRSLLSILIPYNECSIKIVAETLRMSRRTLQRRLAAHGTNFQEVLDSVRADFALRHVKSSELPLYEISNMLGYRTPSAFARAFRRWHGESPRAMRQSSRD